MAKRSFILFHDYFEQFMCLSDEECGKLIKAIFIYETEGERTALPPESGMAFRFIRNALDENRGKYEEICKKRREAGKKGGAPLGNSNAKKNFDDETTKCLNKQPKQPDTDTVTGTGTGTVTETETETVTETKTEFDVLPLSETENKENNTHTHTKTARGEFLNVFLTSDEMTSLVVDYGTDTVTDAINLLSTRIARDNNSRYKDENHYATIKSWVITAVKEQRLRDEALSRKEKTKQEEEKSALAALMILTLRIYLKSRDKKHPQSFLLQGHTL